MLPRPTGLPSGSGPLLSRPLHGAPLRSYESCPRRDAELLTALPRGLTAALSAPYTGSDLKTLRGNGGGLQRLIVGSADVKGFESSYPRPCPTIRYAPIDRVTARVGCTFIAGPGNSHRPLPRTGERSVRLEYSL